MGTKAIIGGVTAVVFAGVMSACGGSSSPTAPGGGSGGGSSSGPGPVGVTIAITSGGMTPNSASIAVGQSVTLVNNDSRSHEISSDPHPSHTECPSLNFGPLGPGQSRTSNAFTTARTCGYHDHGDPSNPAWRGQVTVR